MSKHAKILLIIFIIALAVIVYFIMFGNKNTATTTTNTAVPTPGVNPVFAALRTSAPVTDPAQRYIGVGRPGITPTATT